MSSPHILVVCTANICRSPVAEVLLHTKLQTAGLANWSVSSAGTWAEKGHTAASFSIALMAERGLDIRGHCSQPVTETSLQRADLVLCMETSHVRQLQKAFSDHQGKIFTLRQMVNKRGSVKDPYGRSRRHYVKMVTEVNELIEQGFTRIQAEALANNKKRSKDGTS